jgi:hypothetical protein
LPDGDAWRDDYEPARNRVLANATALIDEIERCRNRHGRYPDSLFSIWGDYKPSIVGVERYHYERSGDGRIPVVVLEALPDMKE